jgi:hypothetical protein
MGGCKLVGGGLLQPLLLEGGGSYNPPLGCNNYFGCNNPRYNPL